MDLRFVPPSEDIGAYVQLELLAASTYVDFLYRDPEVARRIHGRLVGSDIGEFASPHGWLALDERAEAVGMLAGPLDAKSLARARLRTASALLKDEDFAADPAFRSRATGTRSTFLVLTDGDAYLSRIAVAPTARRRGVGRALLDRFLKLSRAAGARRAVLEVSPQHEHAIAMYRAAGFEDLGEAHATADGRELRYLHLGMPLVPRAGLHAVDR